jgi:hypothetical protein
MSAFRYELRLKDWFIFSKRNSLVIWTDSSLIKICILYPLPFQRWGTKVRWSFSFRKNIQNVLWEIMAKSKAQAKNFKFNVSPGDLRWINIPFSMCSYSKVMFMAIWMLKRQHKMKGEKDYLWSRRNMCVNISLIFIFSPLRQHLSSCQQFLMLLEFLKERAHRWRSHRW